ncbi:MAG: proton-conducting transporter membrane subunit, partial [Oscillibacter sp.]
MRPFVENLPFFCIFLPILAGIFCATLRSGKRAYYVTLAVCGAVFFLSIFVLEYTVRKDFSFVYTMGRFPAPYGNAIKCGPLQALMAMMFSAVMALSLVGGSRDLFHDVLPEKQHFYFVMANLLTTALLSLTYTNDLFTGYVFIEISTIAACALVMAKDNGPNLIATIRYLFMSLLGSGLFLIGVTFLNSVTGHLLMPPLAEAVAGLRLTGEYHLPLTVAAGLMTAGLGIKSAMFPFHLWLPDAHGGASTASSAILSGLVLKGYILFLLTLMVRVFSLETMRELGLTNVILVFGLLGMVFGSVGAM